MKDQIQELLDEGFIPLYKSEPPFMPFPNGHGFLGVLLLHKSGKVQCHLCGVLKDDLGRHLRCEHDGWDAKRYRKEVGLNSSTPICSPAMSERRIKTWKNYSPETKKKQVEILKKGRALNKKGGRKGKRGSMQDKNRVGSCDLQLKTRFLDVYKKTGTMPTTNDLPSGLRSLMYLRFGTYDKALEAWGFDKNAILKSAERAKLKHKKGINKSLLLKKLYTKESVLLASKSFAKKWGRAPRPGDFRKRITHQENLPHWSTVWRLFGKGAEKEINEACSFVAKISKLKRILGIKTY